MEPTSRIFVAGHRGLVGSGLVRALTAQGYVNLITRTRGELDLLDSAAVERFYVQEQPEFVLVAAAKVGGILANDSFPADFIRENLLLQLNIIDGAWRHGVNKLLFLGSACVYPKVVEQPIREEALLSGLLEPTNEPYAIAKIAGLSMCQSYNRQFGTHFISVMPTNLYGPNDNFSHTTSHVLPALMRRFHEAKLAQLPSVRVWGTGKPRREFLHVDDMASACVFVMQHYDRSEILNVGCGVDVEIGELAALIKRVVGYEGAIEFDTSRPDGTPARRLDVSRLAALGWQPQIGLEHGLKETYRWFLAQDGAFRDNT
ncbi:MAG: NAD-dependent epimerase/dehydratase [Gemmatimonadetes bacterium]|nr:NAD-dependent epimerase/dehydratase [Gemmatimonadota bacterium]